MRWLKKELVEVIHYYDATQTKTSLIRTPKDGLEFYYEEYILPDIFNSNLPEKEFDF